MSEYLDFYFDTEFIDLSTPGTARVHLVSIGIVTEARRSIYRVNARAPLHRGDDWFRSNVVPVLEKTAGVVLPPAAIACDLRAFVDVELRKDGRPNLKPRFWAYYADYDWVLLCSVFGGMLKVPDGWPHYCMDLRQELLKYPELGTNDLPQPITPHNALSDAWSVLDGAIFLRSLRPASAAIIGG